ncbi:MAG: hypothetical protein EPO39_05605 [Candidatus Manganitrophaceae bacterium]|nr:MAG: hypothetical protein EPO39_05605 [Candidatus Manganitrophaceae bacterium]
MIVSDFKMNVTLMLILIAFLLSSCAGGRPAEQKNAVSSATAQSSRNEKLLTVASPFEDITEYVLAGQKEKITLSLKAYGEQAPQLDSVLSRRAKEELKSLVSGIEQAQRQGHFEEIALKSVEAYRVLIESLDRGSLQAPVEVSLLDYAGFKTRALLHRKAVDWSSIQSTVNEAQQHWNAIEPRVMDKGLRDAVNTAMEGMKKASAARNTDMADFAAQVDLALVDLLEGYFRRTAK